MNSADDATVPHLIRERSAGHPVDGRKVGLAVEGGGMRGIVSGGMLLALRDLGLLDAFDAFYGTSSGSLNLAYLLGGADWEGLSVYYDHLTSGFVRRRDRWRVNQPVLDMDYAFGEVMTHRVPVNWAAIADFDRPIHAVLTNVDAIRRENRDLRLLGDDALAYVRAGAWMPWLAGPPPVVDGTRYLDGGLLCPDPVYSALDDGCSHVLVLNSFPQGRPPAVPRSRRVVRRVLDRWQPGLGDEYLATRIRWDADCGHARFDRDTRLGDAVVHRVATPPGAHRVSQLTMRRDRLLDGVRAGYRTVTDLFGETRRPYFALALR